MYDAKACIYFITIFALLIRKKIANVSKLLTYSNFAYVKSTKPTKNEFNILLCCKYKFVFSIRIREIFSLKFEINFVMKSQILQYI